MLLLWWWTTLWLGSTYYPGKRPWRFVLGHLLALIRTEDRPLGDLCIHTAYVHLVSLCEDFQARRDSERRPVGRPRGHGCIRDKQRGAVVWTIPLEILLALLTDWRTTTPEFTLLSTTHMLTKEPHVKLFRLHIKTLCVSIDITMSLYKNKKWTQSLHQRSNDCALMVEPCWWESSTLSTSQLCGGQRTDY